MAVPASRGRARVVFAAVAFAIAVLTISAHYLAPSRFGTLGMNAPEQDGREVVRGVLAGGPAANAGVRAGDVIRLDRMAPAERARLRFAHTGQPVTLVVQRGASLRAVRLVPSSLALPFSAQRAIMSAFALLYAALALLIAIKAPPRLAPALICVFIVGIALNAALTGAASVIPSSLAAASLYLAGQLCIGPVMAAQFAFPLVYPPRASRGQRAIAVLGIPMTMTAVALWTIVEVQGVFGTVSDGMERALEIVLIAFELPCAAAVIDSFLTGPREFRPQSLSAGSTLLLQAAFAVAVSCSQLAGWSDSWFILLAFVPYASGAGMAYAVLRHRLVDLEIFISRAAIFSAVSLALISGFLLAEWAAAQLLEHLVGQRFEESRRTAATGVIALAVGLSANAVHERVAHRLNRVFFAKRYRALEALQRFAHEIDSAGDAGAVVDLIVDVVHERIGTRYVGLYGGNADEGYELLHGIGSELPPHLGPNDALVLRLRHWHQAFVEDVEHHRFPRAFACPMTLRGALWGFMICGPKHDRSAYLPDEREILANLVHHAGFTYAWLTRPPSWSTAAFDQPGTSAITKRGSFA